jgi:hypothetical protein
MNTLSALSARPTAPSRMKTALRIALGLLALMCLPAAAQQVTRPLYLWSTAPTPPNTTYPLSEQLPPAGAPSVSIVSDGSATWRLTPAWPTAVALVSGPVPVRLVISCTGLVCGASFARTVSVELRSNSITIASGNLTLRSIPNTPTQYTVTLNLASNVTVPVGSPFELRVSYDAVLTSINVWPLSAGAYSRVELNVARPSLQVLKTSAVVSDPFNGGSNPKSIPGATQMYTVRVSNQGAEAVDEDTLQIADDIPANTVMCGLTAAPVTFDDGAPASGLTFTYEALGSATDDLDFSSTASGANWSYTPPSSSDCDPNIRRIRIRPGGAMAGVGASGNPSFEIRFQVRVN